MIKKLSLIGTVCGLAMSISNAEVKMESGPGTLKFTGGEGPGKGKHVVLLAGDEEYRSEEAMPMLARLLTDKHGFDATVLFSANPDGTINPDASASLEGSEALDSADTIITSLRFRSWKDEVMEKFQKAVERGIPLISMRTSSHIFNFPANSRWADWSWNHSTGGFGRKVFGETWVSHWGDHGKEATRGAIEAGQEKNPLLNGVANVFGTTDVYEAVPQADSTVLMRGIVLQGMEENSPAAETSKKTAKGAEQKLNEPAMPIAWSREVKNAAGTTNKVLTTSMGAATDLTCEDLRRLIVNGVYWGFNMEIPAKADVSIPATYQPTKFGFKGYKKGMQAANFAK